MFSYGQFVRDNLSNIIFNRKCNNAEHDGEFCFSIGVLLLRFNFDHFET